MLFSFLLNARLWLALAREQAEALVESLNTLPALQGMAQWATFLRNHDELDLSRLTDEQRHGTFAAFAPKSDMQLYGRGIRRRLAPMLSGDRRHIELAYALQFSMPGTPVIRYGEEIGMAENLTLPGRDALRTPMQWDDGPNGGFSSADPAALVSPVRLTGKYGARAVNVRGQQRDPDSLLRWFEQLIGVVRECPEIGAGTWSVLDIPASASVLVHRFDAPEGSILLLHNLADEAVVVDVGRQPGVNRPWEMFADGPYPRPTATLRNLQLNGWGYRWIRLRQDG
jgi:maltose alpha-D-glucosyltransferase/alpha-amylase